MICRIESGQLCERWQQWDEAGLHEQLTSARQARRRCGRYFSRVSRPDPRLAPLAILALLLCACAVMVYRAPMHRYVVACERTTRAECVLEQTGSEGTQRWRVPLGPDASAVVRVLPQRRGPARILLYLASHAQAVFAAEFEGGDAATDAAAAAAQLNHVLRASAPVAARVEVVPPPVFRWLAWVGLVVTGLLIGAVYWKVRSGAAAA